METETRTFFSLFFSAVSSFPAFAAWRLSCFAVNYQKKSKKAAGRAPKIPNVSKNGPPNPWRIKLPMRAAKPSKKASRKYKMFQ
jgi:hypothetical protein